MEKRKKEKKIWFLNKERKKNMVTQYTPQRKKVIEHLKPILRERYFSTEKDYFVSSVCIELGVKDSLVNECLELFIRAGLIKKEGSLIKSAKESDMEKTEVEKEVDKELNKLL